MPAPDFDSIPFFDQDLQPVEDSDWLGLRVSGPERFKGIVRRVYETPFGPSVAIMNWDVASRMGLVRLTLEVTNLLSAPGRPSTHRTQYLRTQRELSNVLQERSNGNDSPRLRKRQQLLTERFLDYNLAVKFVEASLMAQVAIDDLLTWKDIPVAVENPDLKRDMLGMRQRMRVRVAAEHRHTIGCDANGLADLPVCGLRLTLGLD
ncbi:hypothetical protein [Streptomyces sp. NPDC051572]|uniref:hypothetical protein n=1 Tax=Streptomyces sp. NPDC051572 TaxID=3155802 RepID=UPI00344D6F92